MVACRFMTEVDGPLWVGIGGLIMWREVVMGLISLP